MRRIFQRYFDAAEAQRRQAGPAVRTIDLGNGVTIELIRIPAGGFVMGDSEGEHDEHGVVQPLKDWEERIRPAEDLKPVDEQIRARFTEIGERLDLSPNTVKSRYYRAVARLEAALSGQAKEGVP